MIVKEIMNKEVEKMSPKTTIFEAAQRMKEKEVGYVLAVDKTKLAGIITEEDIIEKVVSEGKDPKATTIEDIMVREVIHIGSDSSLEDAAQIMTEKKIKKLPVVENKNLLGIITAQDMIAAEPKMIEQLGELIIFAKKQKRVAG
ncbi:MAG: CBS domain-containing protein [Candidatus Aenigmatarchaeota archaeon]|nr:MAG: CBS domain-containing protein [Candidatus Aenigmarchaeota archaeon]